MILLLYYLFLSTPRDFIPGTIVRIDRGMGLRSASLRLKNENVIRSRLAFEALVILFGSEKKIIYSDYLFENRVPVYVVARRLSKGEHHMPATIVTIPEGFNVTQIADTFASKLPNFDKKKFLASASPKEGFLFPDTYFFLNLDTQIDVLKSMTENFEEKIAPLRGDIAARGKTEKKIIVMASLIEGESQGDADREFISGILWKRLAVGMPLQVDVALQTYKTKGLPQSPIGNPGLLSIKAAIEPKESPYFYYLHDQNGNIHYAKNFEEHKANKLKYLKPTVQNF